MEEDAEPNFMGSPHRYVFRPEPCPRGRPVRVGRGKYGTGWTSGTWFGNKARAGEFNLILPLFHFEQFYR